MRPTTVFALASATECERLRGLPRTDGGRRHPARGWKARPPAPPPDSFLGDKGCDSNPHREELPKRWILPVISRKGAPNVKDLGELRYVSERTFALLHQFIRLAVRWERRTELGAGTTPN
ncbi:hypothetical protein [Streptomyces sp. NBC_00280]|uniref:hypothetical protein n=1 Tax=Streptomyces sp. NBC_00280 TaxID=2975699 RepID=UPI0032525D73